MASLKYPSEWNVTGEQNAGFVIESPPEADYVSFSINAMMPARLLKKLFPLLSIPLNKTLQILN